MMGSTTRKKKKREALAWIGEEAAAEAAALLPILAEERSGVAGGLWTVVKYGDLAMGDARRVVLWIIWLRSACCEWFASSYCTGRVELRQLRGLFKLRFHEVALFRRRNDDEGVAMPLRARVYLTKKKTKRRMTDLEETGYLVPVPVELDGEGFILNGVRTLGTFELTLRDVPDDPFAYKGCVIAKRAREPPATEETAVYGHAKFIDDRPAIPTTDRSLGLSKQLDLMHMTDKGRKKEKMTRWKSMAYYTRTARKAWEDLGKVEEASVDFTDFKRALDFLDVTVLEPRAMRLFAAAHPVGAATDDIIADGHLGITEFEVALMMHDATPEGELTPPDAFAMFDVNNTGRISRAAFPRVVEALGVMNGKGHHHHSSRRAAAAALLGRSLKDEEAHKQKVLNKLFDGIDSDRSGELTYAEFRRAYTRLVNVDAELKKRHLGVRRPPVWLRWFPPAQETANVVNRLELERRLKKEERAEAEAYGATRDHVDVLRVNARNARDERRRAKQSEKDKIGFGAAVDTKLRNKAKNARLLEEQKQRAKLRVEAKVERNRLEMEQAAAKARETVALKLKVVESERERLALVRAAGLDRLDGAGRGEGQLLLREVPGAWYKGTKAQDALADLVFVDLGDHRLEELPVDGFLMWFTSARYVRFAGNRLRALPAEELGKMSRCEILRLEANNLKDIPESIGALGASLRELNLSDNRLEGLPKTMGDLHLVEHLDLSSNKLSRLDDTGLSLLAALRDLNLRGNSLFELPEDLPDFLVSLTRLDVRDNRLHKLPDRLGCCTRLKLLDVSLNQISHLPSSMERLRDCEVFILRENHLVELPAALGGWRSARLVDATSNHIVAVDANVGALRRLCELRLRKNRLTALPPEIGLARRLEVVDLAFSNLAAVPLELGALTFAHTIRLDHNAISGHVAPELGLLRSVTNLDLAFNRIDGLPAEIGGLDELLKIDVSHNRIRRLPEAITACPRLEVLIASANRIGQIPLNVGNMATLRILDLAANVIETIPANLSALINIRVIHLGKNRIKALPLDLANLSDTVDELHVDRNPLSDLPKRWSSKLHAEPGGRARWPSGYDDEAAMDWVRDHRRFYEHALAEWEEHGHLHVAARSNLAAYELAVRERCGGHWEPWLVPAIRAYYFRARRTGNAPKFHRLADGENEARAATERRAEAIRNARHATAIQGAFEFNAILDEVYTNGICERLRQAEIRLHEWREPRHELLESTAFHNLLEDVAKRTRRQDAKEISTDLDRRRRELEALTSLKQHLFDSYGEPADGSHFFPPLYPLKKPLAAGEHPSPQWHGYSMFRNRDSLAMQHGAYKLGLPKTPHLARR